MIQGRKRILSIRAKPIKLASRTGRDMQVFDHPNVKMMANRGIVKLIVNPRVVLTLTLVSLLRNWLNSGHGIPMIAEAVSVQKLSVPDLVVINQLNQHHHRYQEGRFASRAQDLHSTTIKNNPHQTILDSTNQPEAASLINNGQDLNVTSSEQQITFECLISYDKRKDKNLIIKWHHDDLMEPIYQWIPALNKISIAPQYRAYIAPIINYNYSQPEQLNLTGSTNQNNSIQYLEAGFKLIRPSKELGGKYTCSAISTQNDHSMWKKMIVYTPPRSFRFNASKTDIGLQLANQRDRLIHLTQLTSMGQQLHQQQQQQLPLAYRMRGLDGASFSTISPQMFSTIDYVNVNQQRSRSASLPSPATSARLAGAGFSSPVVMPNNDLHLQQQQAQMANSRNGKHNGVKLVCDIDQVFPVPEISIYRLGKSDGSHPEKLAKLDTQIERNDLTGLYHVQVISLIEDEELQIKYGPKEPVYFECLIALTNLELSKYADNKRSIVYRPGSPSNNLIGSVEDVSLDQQGFIVGSGGHSRLVNHKSSELLILMLLVSSCASFLLFHPRPSVIIIT